MGLELRPCPFCGGEADMHTAGRVPSAIGYPLSVHVACCGCSLDMAEPSKGGEKALRAAEKRVAERWNRRAERTCRADLTEDRGEGHPWRTWECSACGGTYEDVNGRYERCPCCGARVVEG